MIQHTFQILNRTRKTKEQSFWKQGIDRWGTFIETPDIKGISKQKKKYFDRFLMESKKQLYALNSSYFTDKLPSTETWRLYNFFREEAVFLDIETEGVGKHCDITVIGLFDGINTKTMIKGVNLDYSTLKDELARYKLIITFNGASFDLPFIKKRYDILPNVPHIDLRHFCARLNIKGGLKEIEKQFNIKRNKIIEKLYGGDVLTLWKMFKGSGDPYYLKLLVEYNEEDIINLKKIMDYCYKELSNSLISEIKQNSQKNTFLTHPEVKQENEVAC